MNWIDIKNFDPDRYGTDALLLKLDHGVCQTIHYGWHDPSASTEFPWRFIDCHDDVGGDFGVIAVNGARPKGTVIQFIPFSEVKT